MANSGIKDQFLKLVMAVSLAMAALVVLWVAGHTRSDGAAGLQPLEHGLLGGTRRGGVANHMDFARPVLQRRLEVADRLVALSEDEGIDALEDHRLAARGVLHVDGFAVGAVEP